MIRRFSLLLASGLIVFMTACGGGGGGNNNPPPNNPVAPTVTVTPASGSVTTAQSLSVTVAVTGSAGTPTGSVTLKSGSYASSATTLSSGSASISVAAGSLAAGADTLTASYTPDTASSSSYTTASGSGSVTVNKATPTVTVTPVSNSIITSQALSVTIAVSGGSGAPTATGSVTLSSGTYTSAATALSNGSATIDIPAGSLATGNDTLAAAYTPDTAGAAIYNTGSGNAGVTVATVNTVSVNQGVSGGKITDQLLGVNMAAWFDPTNSFVVPTLKAAGITALRWPGGSWSDNYHWNGNFTCTSASGNPPFTPTGWADPGAVYTDFISDLQLPLGADVALTADYGTDEACTGPGDPTEASGWVQAWEKAGGTVSHVTVGNEEYGEWETDLHAETHDPSTYATAAQSYYADIKGVDKNVLVGVSVNPGNEPAWDPTVLANAKGSYDFVEYHYYPQAPGAESDAYIVYQGAPDLTTNIQTIEKELQTAGSPDTPIYVGEIGSVYTNPGKQSWSITQGLYAGQVLGEMMNAGVSRLTWWIGFGNCNGTSGNDSSSLYGWQDFGAYNIFSDGSTLDPTCPGADPAGTMSPTAQAFNLYQNVLVNGESVLTPTVAGDTTDVRAYAATHSGGTALVLFNLNETTAEPVQISLSAQNSSSGVTVITYSKAIYDQTNANPPVWASPKTTSLGSQALPLTLTLDPWSMNVVLIE